MGYACVAPKEPKMCCEAMTASCLACSKGITPHEYCLQNPTTIGCKLPNPVLPSSSSLCKDLQYLVNGVMTPWHERNGVGNTCAIMKLHNYCTSDYFNTYDNVKVTSSEACCGCGGGKHRPPTPPATDVTPRISYWCGKVNLHFDVASKTWKSDPSKSNGCNDDKLTYCKKWYPATTSIKKLMKKEKNVFCRANIDPTKCSDWSTKDVYACVAPPATDVTPRISYWCGKVNLHFDVASKTWKSDPSKSNGCTDDKLTYCKKWYPATTSIKKLMKKEKKKK